MKANRSSTTQLNGLVADPPASPTSTRVNELAGDVQPNRRLWRTLVRIEAVGQDAGTHFFLAVVPGWDSSRSIRLSFQEVPEHIRAHLKPGTRLHARVNIGAETLEELYFEDWEAS